MKYSVEAADKFSGFIDYYQGHGHAFTKDPTNGGPIACITLQTWPNNVSTWQEIGEDLDSDITEFADLTEDKSLDRDEADKALSQFLTNTYIKNPDSQKTPFSDWEDSEEDSPTYLIVLHVYKETD